MENVNNQNILKEYLQPRLEGAFHIENYFVVNALKLLCFESLKQGKMSSFYLYFTIILFST